MAHIKIKLNYRSLISKPFGKKGRCSIAELHYIPFMLRSAHFTQFVFVAVSLIK